MKLACRTAVKNKKLTAELEGIIKEAGVSNGCPKQQGTLLYDCASKASLHLPCTESLVIRFRLMQVGDIQTTTDQSCVMQYPDNARENRQKFMLDFIMTGKIQVWGHCWPDLISYHLSSIALIQHARTVMPTVTSYLRQ